MNNKVLIQTLKDQLADLEIQNIQLQLEIAHTEEKIQTLQAMESLISSNLTSSMISELNYREKEALKDLDERIVEAIESQSRVSLKG